MTFRVRLLAAIGSAALAALGSWVAGYAPEAHVGYAILGALLCFLVLKPQPGTVGRWRAVALLTLVLVVWSVYVGINLRHCFEIKAAFSRSADPALVAEVLRCNQAWPGLPVPRQRRIGE